MIKQGIPELDKKAGAKAAAYIDTLLKPVGSLGRLEEIAIQLSEITGKKIPEIAPPGIIVFAADHGIAKEGVSAFPQEVTQQMVSNIVGGGAAISVFGRGIQAEFSVVDVGVTADILEKEVSDKKIRRGTTSFLTERAMTEEEAKTAISIGYDEAKLLIEKGVKTLIIGEVGIGNTTTSSAILAALTGVNPAEIVGLGTGISVEQHGRKIEVVRQALEFHQPNSSNAIDILSKVGGFEVASMAGAMIAAAEHRIPILLDGFICTVAGCLATLITPEVSNYMILSHQSAEPGHKIAIGYLQKRPLLQLDMRLGEGTGAAVAFPILQSAVSMVREMATFESGGVTKKED